MSKIKKILITLAFTLAIVAYHAEVHASCVTHTYYYNGRTVVCTTCCYYGTCNTSCF